MTIGGCERSCDAGDKLTRKSHVEFSVQQDGKCIQIYILLGGMVKGRIGRRGCWWKIMIVMRDTGDVASLLGITRLILEGCECGSINIMERIHSFCAETWV